MGELTWLSEEGDSKLIWDPANQDECDAAEDQFNTLIEKKFKAYEVKKDGSQGKEIKRFNSLAGRIIMVPPLAGG